MRWAHLVWKTDGSLRCNNVYDHNFHTISHLTVNTNIKYIYMWADVLTHTSWASFINTTIFSIRHPSFILHLYTSLGSHLCTWIVGLSRTKNVRTARPFFVTQDIGHLCCSFRCFVERKANGNTCGAITSSSEQLLENTLLFWAWSLILFLWELSFNAIQRHRQI